MARSEILSGQTHIMHIIDSLALGGAERMLVEIANATDGKNYQVSVCITRSNTALAKYLRADICLFTLHRQKKFDVAKILEFSEIANSQAIDLFHVHGRSSFSFLAFVKVLGLVSQPIVLLDQFGGIEIDKRVPFWFRIAKEKVAHYVGSSVELARWATAAGLPPFKVDVIENALDFSRIQQADAHNLKKEINLRHDQRLGLFVGGIRQEKGLDVLIRAVDRLKSIKETCFLIVGGIRNEQYYRHCREEIVLRGLEDRFVFLGERTDVPEILQSVDFALLPSISETGPLVLIEFMAAGLPFVATRVGAIGVRAAELNAPGIVEANDADAFSRALEDLLSLSRESMVKRGKQGQQIATNHFSIHRKMPDWYEVYETVLRRESA